MPVPLPEENLATLRVSADPWALNGPRGLVKRPQIMKSIMMACKPAPCIRLIFLMWIFWTVPLSLANADYLILVPHKARAQTNTLIQSYGQ